MNRRSLAVLIFSPIGDPSTRNALQAAKVRSSEELWLAIDRYPLPCDRSTTETGWVDQEDCFARKLAAFAAAYDVGEAGLIDVLAQAGDEWKGPTRWDLLGFVIAAAIILTIVVRVVDGFGIDLPGRLVDGAWAGVHARIFGIVPQGWREEQVVAAKDLPAYHLLGDGDLTGVPHLRNNDAFGRIEDARGRILLAPLAAGQPVPVDGASEALPTPATPWPILAVPIAVNADLPAIQAGKMITLTLAPHSASSATPAPPVKARAVVLRVDRSKSPTVLTVALEDRQRDAVVSLLADSDVYVLLPPP